jgi:predicted transcriptional regulator
MSTLKQTAIDAISKMPDNAKIDEIMYKLYVIDKINKGEKDIKEGNFVDSNQLRKEIEQW